MNILLLGEQNVLDHFIQNFKSNRSYKMSIPLQCACAAALKLQAL